MREREWGRENMGKQEKQKEKIREGERERERESGGERIWESRKNRKRKYGKVGKIDRERKKIWESPRKIK